RIGCFLLLLQLGIGPRPVLLSPGFQLVGKIGLAALIEDAGCREDWRDERPIEIFAEAEPAKVFTEQEHHPGFGGVFLVMFEELSLPERNRIELLDDRGLVWGTVSRKDGGGAVGWPALFMKVRREIAWKPGEGRVARDEREDIPSGHPLASSPVPLA
ncbi:MAG: hypothetical protein L0Z46_04655, partial [Nitrospiraceae bacterium]|nr:hypothetical protein [Nitrospiraceae bacterium]